MATLESKVPSGPLADKWRKHKADIKLVNPANKRKFEVIVVGSEESIRASVRRWVLLRWRSWA